MRNRLLGKAMALGAVTIVLLLALAAVRDVVDERRMRRAEAERGVAASLAGAQTLLGPVVVRRCRESWTRVDGDGDARKRVAEHADLTQTIRPVQIVVKAGVRSEPRRRGIFEVDGFVAETTLAADWIGGLAAPTPRTDVGDARMRCDAPSIAFVLTDARGIRAARIVVAGSVRPVAPGSGLDAMPQGLHADLAEPETAGPLHVELALSLAGTQALAFTPIADETSVAVASDWPHPSFAGRFLPTARTVRADGFDAAWTLGALATTATQALAAGAGPCALGEPDEDAAPTVDGTRCVDAFGVRFVDPVDDYVLADRATKYGVLFIGLTLAGVAAVDVARRVRVHPVQYLLVGCALAIFFLLLLSLAEHVGFRTGYVCAATATSALLAHYGTAVLGTRRRGLAFGTAIAALYGVLYTLLALEQTALVVGTILLFVVLAAVMVATRRLDWYAVGRRLDDGPGQGLRA